MSLSSRISSLSTRIGQEVKSLWTALGGKADAHSHPYAPDSHVTNHPAPTTRDSRNQVAGSYEAANANIQSHIGSAHAPSDANNYSHPANHAISVITGLQAALDAIVGGALIDDSAPSGADGTLWFNPSLGNLLIKLDSTWVSASGKDGADGVDGVDGADGADASVTDASVTYAKVGTDLKSRVVDNDGAIDFSANGIVEMNVSTNTTVTFTNLQLNKTIKVKIIVTNSSTITFPAYCNDVTGIDPSGTNGTYYAYFDCWNATVSSEDVVQSIIQVV